MTTQRISIAWRNLRYEATDWCGVNRCTRKTILQSLNGSFRTHSLSSLMGPSGAGKTTLLNCLSGTDTGGLCSDSEIYIASGDRRVVSYFVEQHVHQTILGQLTVGQILQYAYRFKNGLGQDAEAMMAQHIEATLDELLLGPQILSRPFAQCSGGEKKRVAIAQELMALLKPTFLFVDEPTTGLDSHAALEVIRSLAQLAKSTGLTIITSIHTPNDETLNHFDKLYVLAKGGICIYSGPPNQIAPYLEQQLHLSLANTVEQPIEALIRLACDRFEANNGIVTLANECTITEFDAVTSAVPFLRQLPSSLPQTRKAFTLTDLYLQMARQCRVAFISDGAAFIRQLLCYIIFIIGFSMAFNSEMTHNRGCSLLNSSGSCERDSFGDALLNENLNYLFFCKFITMFGLLISSTMLFSTMMKVFRSEYRNKWYSLAAYYWATNFISALQALITALVISLSIYFFGGEHAIDDYSINLDRLGQFILLNCLNLLYMQSIGQAIGVAIIDSVEIALFLGTQLQITMMLLDDVLFNTDNINSAVFRIVSDVIGAKYVNRYSLYVFYGIDRCDWNQEYSWIMEKKHVDKEDVPFYIYRLVTNILVLRVASYVIMYAKLNPISLFKFFDSKSAGDVVKPKLLEYSSCVGVDLVKPRTNISSESKSIETDHKILIAFRHLTLYRSSSLYEFASAKEENAILKSLNGQFLIGSLTGLMGMSGAGKSSLLNVLNGRCRTRLSQQTAFHLSKFTKIATAFIAQEVSGHLMQGLTARQLLVYASRLKNRVAGSETIDHEKIAVNLLAELNMADAAETKVENCSGGERKRLALALELTSVKMPNLICIDEPTSGLDTNSAAIVVSTLRSLAHSHHLTIVASIHQPNTELLLMFDQLYVLARGGVCVYSGPPTEIGAHLKQIPQISSTEYKYPIETLIKLSCAGHQNEIVQELCTLANHQIAKSNSTLLLETEPFSDGILPNRTRFSLHAVGILSLRYIAHLRGYLWKEWSLFLPLYIAYGFSLQLFFDSSIALTSGCINYEDNFNATCIQSATILAEQRVVQENLQYNVFFSNFFLTIVIMQTFLHLYRELPLFDNEHRNGWYSTGSWYLMRLLFECLPLLPLILLYAHICNIYAPTHPGIYWHLVSLLTLSIFAIQTICPIFLLLCNRHFVLALSAALGTYFIMVLLSNVYSSIHRVHYIYQLLSTFSISRFTIEGLLLLQYGFGRCTANQFHPILEWMRLEDADYTHCITMLICHLVLFRAASLWLFIIKANPNESRRKRAMRIGSYLV